eukprot:6900494-Karenia_brevis.AAC.1
MGVSGRALQTPSGYPLCYSHLQTATKAHLGHRVVMGQRPVVVGVVVVVVVIVVVVRHHFQDTIYWTCPCPIVACPGVVVVVIVVVRHHIRDTINGHVCVLSLYDDDDDDDDDEDDDD